MTSESSKSSLHTKNTLDLNLNITLPNNLFDLLGYKGYADMLAIHFDEHGDLMYFDGKDHLAYELHEDILNLFLSHPQFDGKLTANLKEASAHRYCFVLALHDKSLYIMPMATAFDMVSTRANVYEIKSYVGEMISSDVLDQCIDGSVQPEDLANVINSILSTSKKNRTADRSSEHNSALESMRAWISYGSQDDLKSLH